MAKYVPDRVFVTLRELEQRLQAMERLSQSRRQADKDFLTAIAAASERAISKVETATDKRFESVNDFRASLENNARMLMPRIESEKEVHALNKKIELLTATVNSRTERGVGISQSLSTFLAIAALLISAATFFVNFSK